MYQRILVPTDGTERTAGALATALHLAQISGGRVIGLYVAADADATDADAAVADSAYHDSAYHDAAYHDAADHDAPYHDAADHDAAGGATRRTPHPPSTPDAGAGRQAGPPTHDALRYVSRRARETEVPCDTVLAAGGPVHDAIIRVARDYLCDLVVMTMRGRHGLAGRLAGGTTGRVLARSAIPVLVVRAP